MNDFLRGFMRRTNLERLALLFPLLALSGCAAKWTRIIQPLGLPPSHYPSAIDLRYPLPPSASPPAPMPPTRVPPLKRTTK